MTHVVFKLQSKKFNCANNSAMNNFTPESKVTPKPMYLQVWVLKLWPLLERTVRVCLHSTEKPTAAVRGARLGFVGLCRCCVDFRARAGAWTLTPYMWEGPRARAPARARGSARRWSSTAAWTLRDWVSWHGPAAGFSLLRRHTLRSYPGYLHRIH